jgi:hypothetical protein
LIVRLLALICLSIAGPAWAGDLLFPVDCTLRETCYIQQYVDRDPGEGVADFTCGPLAYDGHRGTDIALFDEADMRAGVDVLAATGGVVLGVRDGMRDIAQGRPGAPQLNGKDCGNGVLIESPDGWHFQYCHLRKNTVGVKTGQTVAAGDVLGQIGLSGRTRFPHVHLTIRDHARRVIDPFDARQQNEACSLHDRRSLWHDLDAADYQPGGALTAGFLDHVPAYDAVLDGSARSVTVPDDPEAIVFWAHFFGLREGDTIALRIVAPGGETLRETVHRVTRNRAREFRAAGRKRRTTWAPGTYRGQAHLHRHGKIVSRIESTLTLP